MKVRVKLFATFRDGRFEDELREYEAGTTVGEVLESLNIHETDVKIAFVNNRHAKTENVLYDGDVLGLFPPIGGG